MWIKHGKKWISKRAIIGFDHGLTCRVKNMALGPQLRPKTSAFGLGFCLLSPSGHDFHTAWETIIKSYNIIRQFEVTQVRRIFHAAHSNDKFGIMTTTIDLQQVLAVWWLKSILNWNPEIFIMPSIVCKCDYDGLMKKKSVSSVDI